MFGRRRSAATTIARQQFTPPSGLVTLAQPTRSAPFTFDTSGQPAVSLEKVPTVNLDKPGGIDLRKSHTASTDALRQVDLAGIRLQVVLMVDGSGSMSQDYRNGAVQTMITRVLGLALNVDRDGTIPAITYGYRNGPEVNLTMNNFMDAPQLLQPDFGTTAMADAFEWALGKARESGELTLIVNITDGNPDRGEQMMRMRNLVIASSGEPVMVKNLAIRMVSFLEELDDMPSCIEIEKDPTTDLPILDANGNLILRRSNNGVRWIDNVDSKDIDPQRATDNEFALAMADEINTCIEVMARAGILTGVPGHSREF